MPKGACGVRAGGLHHQGKGACRVLYSVNDPPHTFVMVSSISSFANDGLNVTVCTSSHEWYCSSSFVLAHWLLVTGAWMRTAARKLVPPLETPGLYLRDKNGRHQPDVPFS